MAAQPRRRSQVLNGQTPRDPSGIGPAARPVPTRKGFLCWYRSLLDSTSRRHTCQLSTKWALEICHQMGIEFFHLTTTAMLRELASCASPVIIDKTEYVRQEISREASLTKCSRHSRIARAVIIVCFHYEAPTAANRTRGYLRFYFCRLLTMARQHAFAGCNKKVIRSSWFEWSAHNWKSSAR